MTFNPDAALAFRYPEVRQTLTRRDTMLYALGVGYGSDPLDADELRFVYEERLQAAPTLAITLCYPDALAGFSRAVGIRGEKVLHVSQSFELPGPLPVAGTFIGRTEITGVFDKGPQRGALWTYRNRIVDADTGRLVCTLDAASMALGYGGYGGPRGEPPPDAQPPRRSPDHVVDLATLPQAALIYRLSGDYNPVHADPVLARAAGYERPILHGRCTFGVAARAMLRTCLQSDASRLRGMSARFTSPVFPGETIRTEIWRHDGDPHELRFRCSVPARDVRVLDHGRVKLA